MYVKAITCVEWNKTGYNFSHCVSSKASILRAVGRAISHIFKSGGLTDWSFVLHIFDRLLLVVAFDIPVMTIENRDYLKLVLLYIARYCGDSDNRIMVSEPHRAKE